MDSSSNPKYVSTTCLCREEHIKERANCYVQSKNIPATSDRISAGVWPNEQIHHLFILFVTFFSSCAHQMVTKKFSKQDTSIWSRTRGSDATFMTLLLMLSKLFWSTYHRVYKSSPGNQRSRGRPGHKGKWMQKSKGWGGSTRTCCHGNNNINRKSHPKIFRSRSMEFQF